MQRNRMAIPSQGFGWQGPLTAVASLEAWKEDSILNSILNYILTYLDMSSHISTIIFTILVWWFLQYFKLPIRDSDLH